MCLLVCVFMVCFFVYLLVGVVLIRKVAVGKPEKPETGKAGNLSTLQLTNEGVGINEYCACVS